MMVLESAAANACDWWLRSTWIRRVRTLSHERTRLCLYGCTRARARASRKRSIPDARVSLPTFRADATQFRG